MFTQIVLYGVFAVVAFAFGFEFKNIKKIIAQSKPSAIEAKKDNQFKEDVEKHKLPLCLKDLKNDDDYRFENYLQIDYSKNYTMNDLDELKENYENRMKEDSTDEFFDWNYDFRIDFDNLFGLPVITLSCYNGYNTWERSYTLTTFSFKDHFESYKEIRALYEKIKELEEELNSYTDMGGEDKEIVATVKQTIENKKLEGEKIIEQIRIEDEARQNERVIESGLDLFNKAIAA